MGTYRSRSVYPPCQVLFYGRASAGLVRPGSSFPQAAQLELCALFSRSLDPVAVPLVPCDLDDRPHAPAPAPYPLDEHDQVDRLCDGSVRDAFGDFADQVL